MNANEMADLMILFDSGRIYEHSEEIATMLRQQQAEIEALKGEIDDLMKRIIDLRPYKQKIEAMEKAYDAHFKKAQQPWPPSPHKTG